MTFDSLKGTLLDEGFLSDPALEQQVQRLFPYCRGDDATVSE